MAWGFSSVKVKENSKRMYETCLKRAESIGHTDFVNTDGRMDLRHTYRTDMLNYLVYLAFADGVVSVEEVKYINLLMGTHFDIKTITEYANSWGLRSESIKDHPPRSLESFVRSNLGPELGEFSHAYYDLLQLYVTAFNYIGNDLIACNKEILPGEIQAVSSYIMMLTNSIQEIQESMEEYKPTIEYKSGSKVKKEKIENYSYLENPPKRPDSLEREMGDGIHGDRTYKPATSGFSLKKLGSEEYSYEEDEPVNERELEMNYRGAGRVGGYVEEPVEQKNYSTKEVTMSEKRHEQAVEKIENSEKKVSTSDYADEMNVDALLRQLNELTGMEQVKTEINNMINLLKICQIRQAKGLQIPPVTNHIVFLGNPGTGKTTVARILSKIYHGLGVLSKGHMVEVDRSGLVAGYMGQTGEKVMEVVEKAKGGILFIDEAYALAGKQEGDFGQEAIDILNKAMEDNREDLIVIAAGYHDEMQDFLDANPGLRSRFNRTIEFPNYTADELVEIMCNRATSLDYTLTEDAVEHVKKMFAHVLAYPPENFGNARSVRNYLDRVIHNQANRLVGESNFKEEDLMKLTLIDVESEELE